MRLKLSDRDILEDPKTTIVRKGTCLVALGYRRQTDDKLTCWIFGIELPLRRVGFRFSFYRGWRECNLGCFDHEGMQIGYGLEFVLFDGIGYFSLTISSTFEGTFKRDVAVQGFSI